MTCTVGELLDVHDVHLVGTAPTGRTEDYHGIHLIFAAQIEDAVPSVVEVGRHHRRGGVGRPVADIVAGRVEVLDVVPTRLRCRPSRLRTMSETVFTYGAPGLKFGAGRRRRSASTSSSTTARRVLLVTDPGVAATGHPARIAEQIRRTASRW